MSLPLRALVIDDQDRERHAPLVFDLAHEGGEHRVRTLRIVHGRCFRHGLLLLHRRSGVACSSGKCPMGRHRGRIRVRIALRRELGAHRTVGSRQSGRGRVYKCCSNRRCSRSWLRRPSVRAFRKLRKAALTTKGCAHDERRCWTKARGPVRQPARINRHPRRRRARSTPGSPCAMDPFTPESAHGTVPSLFGW